MHCAATDRRAEATRAFIEVANGFQDIKCGPRCVGELNKMLFRALAAMQENKMVESIFRLSLVIEEIKNVRYDCRSLHVPRYQDVIVIAGHFYLASIFDKCGMDPALSDSCRAEALAVIENGYPEHLDKDYVHLTMGGNMYIARWMRSCVGYADKRKADEIASTIQAMDFPFEDFFYYRMAKTAVIS